MSSQISHALTQRIAQLESSRTQLETRLRTEPMLEWGDEFVMRKQALLSEREYIETQLVTLQSSLASIDDNPTPTSTFTVECEGQVKVYTIVPSNLVSPRNGLISQNSPLAKELCRSKIGDVVTVSTAGNSKSYVVVDIK